MKEKNLPDDNSSKTLKELTREISIIIEQLEKQKDLKKSIDDYQKLIKFHVLILTII